MRIAVVDLGTNSTRLLVADVDGPAVMERERRSTITRLGEGVDTTGVLAGAAMQRVFETLADYARRIEGNAADGTVVLATSAVRDATNGDDFTTEIEKRFGWETEILSGEREAELTYAGATFGGTEQDPTLVVDIGGGSTELIVGVGRAIRFVTTTDIGSVRQTERHLADDPPSAEQLAHLRDEVERNFARAVPGPLRAVVRSGIAVAGTPTSLTAIELKLDRYDPARVEGHRLTRRSCRKILAELAALPLAKRKRLTGLHPDRAYAIVAGAVILIATMEAFGLEDVKVSEHDLLYGAAREAAALALGS